MTLYEITRQSQTTRFCCAALTLRQKQSRFASYLTTLLVWLRENEYELSLR